MQDSGSIDEGLFLLVTKAGLKSWRLKYRYGGKEKLLTFGPYPQLSLKEARLRKDEARAELAAGRDPGEQRKKSRARRLGKEEETGTFRAAALPRCRAGMAPAAAEGLETQTPRGGKAQPGKGHLSGDRQSPTHQHPACRHSSHDRRSATPRGSGYRAPVALADQVSVRLGYCDRGSGNEPCRVDTSHPSAASHRPFSGHSRSRAGSSSCSTSKPCPASPQPSWRRSCLYSPHPGRAHFGSPRLRNFWIWTVRSPAGEFPPRR